MLTQSRSGPAGSFFAALLGAAVVPLASPAAAEPEIFPTLGITWTVQPAFGQAGEGRDNLSGATCMTVPPGRICLVVNDTTRFAQLFSVKETEIRPGPVVGITSDPPLSTLTFAPNMEGTAHDDRFFYVVTSRGRTGSIVQPDSTFLVARFTPDPVPREPPVPFFSRASAGIQFSERIRTALTAGIPIPQLPGRQLDRANAEIEGIAVKVRERDRVLHLGFRTPVLGGNAFILSASVEDVFASSGPLNATVHMLALGPTLGIRDLAAVSEGVLILAGPGRGVPARSSLFLWNDTTGQLKLVAILAEPVNRNGEALLVLHEDPEFFRFLVMFDGIANGSPVEYFAPR